MNRTLRNIVAVLVLTAFTAIAVVATVQATDRIVGTDAATAASASVAQTSAQDGSAGSGGESYGGGYGNGHGQDGSGDQGTTQESQSTGPYGYDSSVYTPDADGLMYCPATGCAETSCHALQ